MNFLITGGNGFLGYNLVKQLSKNNNNYIVVLDKSNSKFSKKNLKKIKFIKGDINNKNCLNKIKTKIDYIYHFAGFSELTESINLVQDTVKLNIEGTVNILNFGLTKKIKRFIFASSAYVDSSDGGFYRVSKFSAEQYIDEYNKLYGLKFTILRFGSLYGKYSSLSNGLTKILLPAIENKKLVYEGNPAARRKYLHVQDMCCACLDILKPIYENKYINITGKKTISIKKLMKFIAKKLKLRKKYIFLNKKNTGHFVKKFTPIRKKIIFNYRFKKNINLNEGITELINYLSK